MESPSKGTISTGLRSNSPNLLLSKVILNVIKLHNNSTGLKAKSFRLWSSRSEVQQMQRWMSQLVYCRTGQNILRMTIQLCAGFQEWGHFCPAFALEVAEALVLCGLKTLVSTPANSIAKRIHLEIVSLETCL